MSTSLSGGKFIAELLIVILVFSVVFVGTSKTSAEGEIPESNFGLADYTVGFNQTYGGYNSEVGYAMVQTSDGGYAITGYTSSFGSGSSDVWLVKTDANGAEEWNQTYGEIEMEIGYSIVETNDSGYAIAGIKWTPNMFDVWLIKTDSAGTEQWNRTYGRAGNDRGYSVVQTSDGGYAIAGYTNSSSTLFDVWLIKTDSAGTMQWNQTYGGTKDDYGRSVVQTSDGGYAIAGDTESSGAGRSDVWLIKTDSGGAMQWNQIYGGRDYDLGYSLVQTGDGDYVIAGKTWSFGSGGPDAWVIKTDSGGAMRWNQTYGGTNREELYSVIETDDGGYALGGMTGSFGEGFSDVWVIKTDSAGTVEWNRTYGGTGNEFGYSLVQVSDEVYAIAGYTDSSGGGLMDFWLINTGTVNPLVPEFTTWLLMLFLISATLFAFSFQKRLKHR